MQIFIQLIEKGNYAKFQTQNSGDRSCFALYDGTCRGQHNAFETFILSFVNETKRNVENKSRVLLNSASKMQHILWASIGTLLHISYTQLSNSVILQMIFASYSIFDSSTPILFLCVETLLVFLVSFLLVKRGWTRFEYVFSIILVQYFFFT